MGTLGIMLSAKRHGLISKLQPQMDALIATGFFLGPELYGHLLDLAGEE
jgi:predicted nucleic acid-binding protein